VYFEILGEISEIETIAQGRGIRRLQILKKKVWWPSVTQKKGIATVQLGFGSVRLAEVH